MNTSSRMLAGAGVALVLALPATVCARGPDNENAGAAGLDRLVVTTSPSGRFPAGAMQSVSVIERADIEAATADNLADLLAGVAGLDVRRRGAPGVQADVGIRGSSFEQTLVLVDGIVQRDAQTGHHDLDLPVPLAHVERIEIIKGPGSVQYGGSATGGVINIITRQPDGFEAGGELGVGSHAARRLGAHVGSGDGRNAHLVSAAAFRTDGEHADRPTDADIRRATYTGRGRLGRTRLNWGLGAQDREFGAWKFYTADFPDQRERTDSRLAWVGARRPAGAWDVNARVHWRGHEDWFRTLVGETAFINRHRTRSGGGQVDARIEHGGGTTALGLGLRSERIESNALADHDRDETSLWLVRRQSLGERLVAEASLNRVDYSEHRRYWLPAAALSWQFNDHWRGFAATARSARVPSYTELYLDTGGNRGNPGLAPERSEYHELGLIGRGQAHRLQLALFQRRTRDLIDWARLPGEVTWQADNFSGHRGRGAEIEWRWRPAPDWLRELGLSHTRLQTRLDAGGREIKYALDAPRRSWRAHARLRLGRRTGVSISARRAEPRRDDPATLVALRLDWRTPPVQWLLEGHNLLDREVIETGFAPAPGRRFHAGMRVIF